jgi:hypothetical protein
MTVRGAWGEVGGRGRRAVARAARVVLPGAVVRLSHVEPGLSLRVDLRRNVMFWSRGLARFEPEAVRALRAAAEPGGVAFDVGANVGFFSTLLAHWVGPGGRVVAVEPDADTGASSIGTSGRTAPSTPGSSPARSATRGASPTSAATPPPGRPATSGPGRRPASWPSGPARSRWSGPGVETIDGLAEDLGLAPDLLKIDIEGGEARALDGAARTLAEARPVIVSEISGDGASRALAILDRAGYAIWDLEAGRRVGIEDRPFMIAAVPAEAVETGRGRRIEAAVIGGRARP